MTEINPEVAEQKAIYASLDAEGKQKWSDLYETLQIFTDEELQAIKETKKTYWFETYEGESK